MYIFIMNRYISKSYTGSKNPIYRAGAAVVSTITSNSEVISRVPNQYPTLLLGCDSNDPIVYSGKS